MNIRRAGVIGAGQMGSGIAQVFAQAGIEVVMQDIDEKFIQKGFRAIEKSFKKNIEKEKMTQEECDTFLSRIKGSVNLSEAAKNADIIVEAVVEDIQLKKEVFAGLDKVCPKRTIIASNTSSFSITEIATVTEREDRILGLHFFNPVQVMNLVEIVKGYNTSNETIEVAEVLLKRIGKEPIEAKDSPGFVVNRILVPMLNDAVFALMEGVATKEAIDKGMKLGCNHPMGPLELLDFVGLDTVLKVMEYYYEEFGDPKYRPCPLLRQMVRAGRVGRKVGKGFYDYAC
jgi:3-hydroxybutyryl-CoA dehydrogenase